MPRDELVIVLLYALALHRVSSCRVIWTSPPNLDTVQLYLTQRGTPTSTLLYSGEDNNSYTWSVDDNDSITAGSGYRLLIVSSNSTGHSASLNATTGYFQVCGSQPQVTITSIFTGNVSCMIRFGAGAFLQLTNSCLIDPNRRSTRFYLDSRSERHNLFR